MDISKAKAKAEELVVRLRELVGVLRDSGPTPEWEAAEKNQVLLFFLKEQLSQILDEVGGAVRKGSFNGIT